MNPTAMKTAHDRIRLSELPANIQTCLMKRNLVTSNGEKASFCGLVNSDGQSHVFLPRQMDLDPENIPVFFESIRKYSLSSDSLVESEDGGDQLVGQDCLDTIFNIFEDYCRNGIYFRRSRYNQRNSGKIDWKKTIRQRDPVISSNGPVYLEYTGLVPDRDMASEVSRIHFWLMQDILEKYGFLLPQNISLNGISMPLPSIREKGYFVHILQNELKKAYSDRDIFLFRNMISYIEENHGINHSEIIVGIKRFHYVWENMLRETVSGVVNLNSRFSVPTYVTSNGRHLEAANKGQRADIIVYDGSSDTYAVVDAKYYDATDLFNAPGWSDLLKQFFYAKAIKSLYPKARVKNFFIFPGMDDHFERAYMKDRSSGKTDIFYEDIHCIYVDPSYVMNSYVSGSTMSDINAVLIG